MSEQASNVQKAIDLLSGMTREEINTVYKTLTKPGWIEKQSSGVPNINWDKDRQKWRVMYKRKYVGMFKDLEAAKAALEGVKQ